MEIATTKELYERLFEVIASLTPEEKREWARELIAWANEGNDYA